MTHIEKAIREAAFKGGYKRWKDIPSPLKGGVQIDLEDSEVLLDPTFWQALGKARGWSSERSALYNRPIWHAQWIYFIDHLAEGKDAESFFAAL